MADWMRTMLERAGVPILDNPKAIDAARPVPIHLDDGSTIWQTVTPLDGFPADPDNWQPPRLTWQPSAPADVPAASFDDVMRQP